MGEVSLSTLGGGAALELFQRELEQVMDNIRDPNTDPEEKRTITITVTFLPDAQRQMAQVGLEARSKLAGSLPAATAVWFGRREGRNVAVEHNPRQAALFDESQVDKGTGEIR